MTPKQLNKTPTVLKTQTLKVKTKNTTGFKNQESRTDIYIHMSVYVYDMINPQAEKTKRWEKIETWIQEHNY